MVGEDGEDEAGKRQRKPVQLVSLPRTSNMPVRPDASLSTKMPACLRGSRELAAFMWFASDKQQASPRLSSSPISIVPGPYELNQPSLLPSHNTETGNACDKDVFDWDAARGIHLARP